MAELPRRLAPSLEGEPHSLGEARADAAHCTRCDLYKNATQTVFGEGPPRATIMLVGEQPGDREDIEGHPFVGPAGRILDRALADAGIPRDAVFLTNAVKHFKNEPRGKRRLHKKPNSAEIDICRWWLDLERRFVRPSLIIALGATALRGLIGRTVSVASFRGQVRSLPDGTAMVATVHPSFLLRIEGHGDVEAEYRRFVADLALAKPHLRKRAAVQGSAR